MTDSNLLLTTKESNENVYYLSKEGADRVGVDPIKKNIQIEHYLLRNEAWMILNFPKWHVEAPINLTIDGNKKSIIPDAQYVKDTLYCVEIDNKQRFIRNKQKIEMYKILASMYERKHGKKIILQFFTKTHSRKQKIEELTGDLICEVYVIEY